MTFQIPKKKSEDLEDTLVEVTFRLEDLDADVMVTQDDEMDNKIESIMKELKNEEQRYVDVLGCISKVE